MKLLSPEEHRLLNSGTEEGALTKVKKKHEACHSQPSSSDVLNFLLPPKHNFRQQNKHATRTMINLYYLPCENKGVDPQMKNIGRACSAPYHPYIQRHSYHCPVMARSSLRRNWTENEGRKSEARTCHWWGTQEDILQHEFAAAGSAFRERKTLRFWSEYASLVSSWTSKSAPSNNYTEHTNFS